MLRKDPEDTTMMIETQAPRRTVLDVLVEALIVAWKADRERQERAWSPFEAPEPVWRAWVERNV